ncbi:MAG: hypothetical protein QM498_03725 [Desulfobacterium sp.]
MVKCLQEISKKYDISIGTFGHAGAWQSPSG